MKEYILLFIGCVCLIPSCAPPSLVSDDQPTEYTFLGEKKYDETGCSYTSYTGLVMAGYQGWFAAEGDGSGRGWYHYKHRCGFQPECSTIDMWPDMSEYQKKYVTPFVNADGTNAYLYSAFDEESIDLHFKWMKEYGIDGVHMQRFLAEVKPHRTKGKNHFNKVLKSALKAAKKYDRAISVMYDLSGSSSEDMRLLEADWKELQETFNLFNNKEHPTYLRHNGKPMLSIWGVGFNDKRNYSIEDVDRLVGSLKGDNNQVSVMLGVPYYWRTLGRDTQSSSALHKLIRKVDIIMPWAVGRYNNKNYTPKVVEEDVTWCKENGVDYVPLVYPGFTWGNMKKNPRLYNQIPRMKGDFLWKQVSGAYQAGATSLYVAMFDEVDEGTAIFKVLEEDETPLNGELKFLGIEQGLGSDYYLWLVGQASNWFHGNKGYSDTKPKRD